MMALGEEKRDGEQEESKSMYQLPLCGKIHIIGLVAGGNFFIQIGRRGKDNEKIYRYQVRAGRIQTGKW